MFNGCFLSTFVVLWTLAEQIDSSCTDSSNCQLKCHCNGQCPNNDGQCTPSSKCKDGWFGLRCQYQDLMVIKGAKFRAVPRQDINMLTDKNDQTCVKNLTTLEVTWTKKYPITWIRLVASNIFRMLDVNLDYREDDETTVERFITCKQKITYLVDNKTLDLRCLDNVTSSAVKIEGQMAYLCSIYISGGRNLAYKQQASLSTAYTHKKVTYDGDKAVDGDTSPSFNSKSCAHSGTTETTPKLTVTISQPALIHRIILYNRDKDRDRLSQFRLELFNNKGNRIFFLKDSSTSGKEIYDKIVNRNLVKQIMVTATKTAYRYDDYPILTICELEAFGECPAEKWGLTCANECPEQCKTHCHIDDGECNSFCVGFSDPPYCKSTCLFGKWGINCKNNCSRNCLDLSCDRHTGECDKGCLGYSDPPVCKTKCSFGLFGENCNEKCPTNCYNGSCDPILGNCYQCKDGYLGNICLEPCPTGSWGTDCSKRCSSHCYGVYCNNMNGDCVDGCQSGYQLAKCYDVCKIGTYGRNCSQNCSSTCLNATCDPVSGICQGCADNFHGDICNLKSPNASQTSFTGAIISVFVVVLIFLAVIIFLFRNKLPSLNDVLAKCKKKASPENDCPKEENYLADADENDSDSSTDDDSEPSLSISKFEVDRNIIRVEDLHTFLKTKSKEYFNQQFKKIPAAKIATTSIGLSEENRYKNRYKDIVTYDHSRVQLQVNEEEREYDYINASYIKGFSDDVRFIASQGPNRAMINDFIRMLWEQKTDKVVMLTNLVESGKIKCERYWPEKGMSQFGPIKVNVISTHIFSDYVIRNIELVKRNAPRQLLTQYHFTSWPDKNVPDTPWSLVDFYFKLFSTTTVKPIVVHCSAGVGRTGTFIALCNIVDQARETDQVNFFNTLTKLRQDRICMIQTADQYQFLHTSAQVAIMCMDSIITHDNVSYKSVQLNKKTSIGSCKMEEEYKVLCEVVQSIEDNESIKDDLQDDIQIYQNSECITKIVKDRFPEFAPNEPHRVVLNDDSTTDDYIHAVYVQGYIGTDLNILTQLPMPVTVVDFWRCVLSNKMSLIVAFEVDSYLSDKSAAQYLPGINEQTFMCPPFKVQSSSLKSTDSWEERKLIVHWKSSVHRLVHLKCNINDTDSRKLFTIVKQIRTYDCHGNVLYMCKNGATLSGIACILTVLLERLDNDLYVSVPLVVGAVKTVRPQAISRLVEYRSLFEVLERYIETSSVYNNTIDLNIESKFNSTKVNPSNEMFVEDQSVYANY